MFPSFLLARRPLLPTLCHSVVRLVPPPQTSLSLLPYPLSLPVSLLPPSLPLAHAVVFPLPQLQAVDVEEDLEFLFLALATSKTQYHPGINNVLLAFDEYNVFCMLIRPMITLSLRAMSVDPERMLNTNQFSLHRPTSSQSTHVSVHRRPNTDLGFTSSGYDMHGRPPSSQGFMLDHFITHLPVLDFGTSESEGILVLQNYYCAKQITVWPVIFDCQIIISYIKFNFHLIFDTLAFRK